MKTINSINKHQSRLNDSRLAPFVSMTAMKTRLCRGALRCSAHYEISPWYRRTTNEAT
jgi:hypothetical protein